MFAKGDRPFYRFDYQPVPTTETKSRPSLRHKELLSKSRGFRLSRWIIIIIGAIVIIALVYLLYNFFSNREHESQPEKAPFTLENYLHGKYASKMFNGSWVSASQFIYTDMFGNVIMYDCNQKAKEIVVPYDSDIVKAGSFLYLFSPDLKYLMYAFKYTPLYRHSYTSIYMIYNMDTKKQFLLNNEEIQLAVWAPKGNSVAYVKNNNIFYRSNPEEQTEVQLTFTGSRNQIYNGVPDWVYEEEILSSNTAMWFSKNGSRLAYISFNDTLVPAQNVPVYGTPGDPTWQYTQYISIRYPKVGRQNPEVSVHVIDLTTNLSAGAKEYALPPPDKLLNSEPIVTSVTWATDSDLVIIWSNRFQNATVINYCTMQTTYSCQQVFEISVSGEWLVLDPPVFDNSGKRMAFILNTLQSDGSKYPHINLLDLTQANPTPVALTSGKFTVSEIATWDSDEDMVYFISTIEDKPEQLHTQRVSAKTDGNPNNHTCLSCNYTTIDNKKCEYCGASFSNNANYFALTCAGSGIPEATLFTKEGNKVLHLWEDNAAVRKELTNIAMPTSKLMRVPLSNGFNARVKLTLPYGVDTSGDTKYPMLVHVYSGPDSSLVTNRFSIDFGTYYTANKSVVQVSIDGRGNNLQGSKMLYSIYRKLGTLEIEDQLTVIKYLLNNLSYLDKTRVAVWGWSYGGYATGMMLAEDVNNTIKCGVMIAPVTDWILYDSIYTERFMGSIVDNYNGYVQASLIKKAKLLKDKQFLLIHGTRDDNVHYQNSMLFAKVLERNDIMFRQMSYPDEDHGLKSVQPHFYHTIQYFFEECFAKTEQ